MASDLTPDLGQRTDSFPWGTMTWILSHADRERMGLALARMVVAPGMRCGAHIHENASETVIVEDGSIDIRTRLIRVRLKAGEHQVIPIGTAHELMNLGEETAVLTIAYSHPERAFEATTWLAEKRKPLKV